MDFFEHQAQAQAASRRLLLLYVLAVLGVLVSIHVLAAFVLSLVLDEAEAETAAAFMDLLLQPSLAAWTFGLGALVILGGTVVKVLALRGGGSKVAESMGAREVSPDTQNFEERRLIHIVEEMALAAGMRIPRVYALDNEAGINAFAAGYSPDDAAVAVTSGLLRKLDRNEMQAVIGHEFSHILNGDMRLNIRLLGILGGLLGIAVIGRVVIEAGLRSMALGGGRRRSSRKNGPGGALALMALGAGVWLVGSLGVLFGRMIQAALSRQREYLADASSVQFTRNPSGLAGALKLIGANTEHGRLHNGHAAELAHMLFAGGGVSLFATHPALPHRIRRLDPHFDGDFTTARKTLKQRTEARAAETATAKAAAGGSDPDGIATIENLFGRQGPGGARGPGGLAALALAARAERVPPPLPRQPQAAPTPRRRRNAGGMPDLGTWLSGEERDALRHPDAAECCLYASILGADETVRAQQLDLIRKRDTRGAEFANSADAWHQRHQDWTSRQRRMVCELAVECLRSVDPGRRQAILQRIDALARVDGRLHSHEFALSCLVRRRLTDTHGSAAARAATRQPRALAAQAATVLSLLAATDAPDPAAAESAWEAAQEATALFGHLTFVPPGNVSFEAFEAALADLQHLPPLAKREFMAACERVAQHDRLSADEENYLVAIADAIDAVGWSLAA